MTSLLTICNLNAHRNVVQSRIKNCVLFLRANATDLEICYTCLTDAMCTVLPSAEWSCPPTMKLAIVALRTTIRMYCTLAYVTNIIITFADDTDADEVKIKL